LYQPSLCIDLVEEDRNGPMALFQDDAKERLHESVQGGETLVVEPEIVERILQAQLGADLGKQGVLPLLRGGAGGSERGELHRGHRHAGLLQSVLGVGHQGALADLPAVEDVAELACPNRLEKLLVGAPGNVAGGLGMALGPEGTAGCSGIRCGRFAIVGWRGVRIAFLLNWMTLGSMIARACGDRIAEPLLVVRHVPINDADQGHQHLAHVLNPAPALGEHPGCPVG
jgi:hypothetical protein